MQLDNFGPDVKSVTDVLQQVKNDISGEKCFWEINPPNGRVVKGPLEPLSSGSVGGRGRETHHIPCKGADSLAPHGVSLVCHGATPDLTLGKWLLDFLEVGEEADVAAHFVRRLCDTRKNGEDIVIDFSGVGLARDGN